MKYKGWIIIIAELIMLALQVYVNSRIYIFGNRIADAQMLKYVGTEVYENGIGDSL